MKLSRGLDLLLVLVACVAVAPANAIRGNNTKSGTPDGSEKWGYIEVRPKAHMFWWFYRSPKRTGDPWPIVLWLQGGPGGSGVGIGNFQEVGPLDTNLKPRNTTWLQKADLLFVDSPVGTGFSYVEDDALAVQTDEEATQDLLIFLKELHTNTTLLKGPLFIVGESYGGRHASMLGLAVSKAIAAGQLNITLGGVALGDSWISPVDYVLSWGPLLRYVSRLDAADEQIANSLALNIQQQVQSKQYGNATNLWTGLEVFIVTSSSNVDFYNFLLDSNADPLSTVTVSMQSKNSGGFGHYKQYLGSRRALEQLEKKVTLDELMNGAVRNKLKIIPQSIQWGGQSDLVFSAMANVFMKDVIDQVDQLLSQGVNVTIYSGQVDVICSTIGTESWVQKLKWWSGLKGFNAQQRDPIYCNNSTITKGFVKSFSNLHFFWVLEAGHFVPVDQPCVASQMLDTMFKARA